MRDIFWFVAGGVCFTAAIAALGVVDLGVALDRSATTAFAGVILGAAISIVGAAAIEHWRRQASARPHMRLISEGLLELNFQLGAVGLVVQTSALDATMGRALADAVDAHLERLRRRVEQQPDLLSASVVEKFVRLRFEVDALASRLRACAPNDEIIAQLDAITPASRALDRETAR
jgi:hypothetical protein